jgi:hypothetical protein
VGQVVHGLFRQASLKLNFNYGAPVQGRVTAAAVAAATLVQQEHLPRLLFQ